MAVLYDMVELSAIGGKSIGIYNYALGLLSALARGPGRDWPLRVACHAGNEGAVRDAVGGAAVVDRVYAQPPGALQRQVWMRMGCQWRALRQGCDIYLSPKGFMPGWWGSAAWLRSCVVVHDLIPLWYAEHAPGHFSRLEARVVNGGLLRSCRHADRVIAISRATAADVERCAGRRANVVVIHNGMDSAPAPARVVDPSVTDFPVAYILAMATPLPHKNLGGTLAAYEAYRARVTAPLPMVVCGAAGGPGSAVPAGVRFVRGLTRAALFDLYRRAAVFVCLPLTEGFGYPPLEAMQCQIPVLCSAIPALRESTAGAARYVDPADPAAAGEALAELLSEGGAGERQRQRAAAREVLSRYTWDRAAAAVGVVVESLRAGTRA